MDQTAEHEAQFEVGPDEQHCFEMFRIGKIGLGDVREMMHDRVKNALIFLHGETGVRHGIVKQCEEVCTEPDGDYFLLEAVLGPMLNGAAMTAEEEKQLVWIRRANERQGTA